MLCAPAFQDSITPSRVFRKIASCDDSTIAARSPVSACLASSVFDMRGSFPRRSGLVPPGGYVWLTSRLTQRWRRTPMFESLLPEYQCGNAVEGGNGDGKGNRG